MHNVKFSDPRFNKVMAAMSQLKRQIHSSSFGGEIKILHYLAHNMNRNVLPTEMCKSAHMTSPRVARALNSLEKKNLVKRTHSTKDRREVFVHISKNGLKTLQDRMENLFSIYSKIFNELDKKDCDNFISILEKITKIATKHFGEQKNV